MKKIQGISYPLSKLLQKNEKKDGVFYIKFFEILSKEPCYLRLKLEKYKRCYQILQELHFLMGRGNVTQYFNN